MDERDWKADEFEKSRAHLRAVAYRMLGSIAEADDAVQEAWLRFGRSDTDDVANVKGWLTTVVARICLDAIRSRNAKAEQPIGLRMPEPLIARLGGSNPEYESLLADSVGLALMIVLETLTPAERLAFVLHDMFGISFDEIAPLVGREPAAARQLASRARRRVQGAPVPDRDLARQREAVEAFIAAARGGDFDALVATLDPDVVLRTDLGAEVTGGVKEFRGADAIARRAIMFSTRPAQAERILVNGAPGLISWTADGQPFSLMTFTVSGGKIVEIYAVLDRERLRDADSRFRAAQQ